ncbi:MAG TPA: hypothetical protein EYP28_07415, partial [Methanophagales archaeon]|nr:hypothetical protein [Methanophagales archaeon]
MKDKALKKIMVLLVLFTLIWPNAVIVSAQAGDSDGDGFDDDVDNCPDVYNPDQTDREATANIVSYWTFDDGSGTIANDSVDANHGTIYGASWT